MAHLYCFIGLSLIKRLFLVKLIVGMLSLEERGGGFFVESIMVQLVVDVA